MACGLVSSVDTSGNCLLQRYGMLVRMVGYDHGIDSNYLVHGDCFCHESLESGYLVVKASANLQNEVSSILLPGGFLSRTGNIVVVLYTHSTPKLEYSTPRSAGRIVIAMAVVVENGLHVVSRY